MAERARARRWRYRRALGLGAEALVPGVDEEGLRARWQPEDAECRRLELPGGLGQSRPAAEANRLVAACR